MKHLFLLLVAVALLAAACTEPGTAPKPRCSTHGDTVSLSSGCTDTVVVTFGDRLPFKAAR